MTGRTQTPLWRILNRENSSDHSAQQHQETNKSPSDSPARFPWILNPVIDILFCCGGIVWLLFALQYWIVDPSENVFYAGLLSISATIAAHTFGETHIAATLFRLYSNKAMRRKHFGLAVFLPIVTVLLCACGLHIPGFTAILLKLYLLWVIQHFTGQTYGFVLIYCFKRGYLLNRLDKLTLACLLNCSAALAIVRQLTFEQWSAPAFLGQQLPFWGPLPEAIYDICVFALQLSAIAFAFRIVKKLIVERTQFPVPAMLLILTIISTLVSQQDAASVLFIYVPSLLHGTQYLALTLSQNLKEHHCDLPADKIWTVIFKNVGLRYFGSLILVAVALFIGVPALISLFGFSWQLAFANVFCLINLHHFLTDMHIWKIRDPDLKSTLV
jgi:hypothetical protein